MKKVKDLLRRFLPQIVANFIAFYTIPGFVIISGKEFDPVDMMIALPIILNCAVSLVGAGYDTWKHGFHWLSIALPVIMFLPSVFFFYGAQPMAFIFDLIYAVPAAAAAVFCYYVRLRYEKQRRF